ncbi:MAG TPA: MEDS domain-containing protein [Pseudonocardiaceae bacterium]|nr:MEDS domain-containing protein [Pseudonocardiaceae bacterium]
MAPTTTLIDTVSHGQHACGIVGSASERLRMLSGFVRSGLAAGDRVWCFPNGCRPEMLDWLRGDVLDEGGPGDDALASGQLSVLPTYESTLSALDSDPDGVLDDLRRAVDGAVGDGWNGFRMIGDLGWATRGRDGAQHLIDFESRVGPVLAELPAATLCQYDRYRFDVDTMATLADAHVAVVGTLTLPAGEELTLCPLPGRSGLRLTGEVDLITRELLTAALDEAVNGPGDVHLEMAELTFIDGAGVQILLQAARRLGPGRQMVVHHPPRSLTVALALLWDAPSLVTVAAGPA